MNFESMLYITNCYFLRTANEAFQAGEYTKAFELYKLAKKALPEFIDSIDKNIALLEKKQNKITTLPQSIKKIAIDIIVPVYNALLDVQNCLASLEKYRDNFNVHIYMINDASDEETTLWLRTFCNNKPSFTLIENSQNLGYTKSVNIGLRASSADYIITQNSDTIVSEGWLCGMIRCMESDERIGIVGPLSNAANYQSVPLLRDELTNEFAVNSLPEGIALEDFSQALAITSARIYPRIPILNGFCFMIKRSVIDSIGYMDEENFPFGYGEENDYCMRAKKAGFQLAVADDVYVYHAKSKSFGNSRRKELSTLGKTKIAQKHTKEYYDDIIKACRTNAELEIIRQQAKELYGSIQFSSNIHTIKLLVHLHIYYHEQVDYFLDKLKNIKSDYDLYVTFVEENKESEVKVSALKEDAHFIKVKNLGYDVYPFWQVLQQIELDDYSYILKLHTKSKREIAWKNKGIEFAGYEWRDTLVDALIDSSKKLFSILHTMETKSYIGMIGSKKLLRSYEHVSQRENTKELCKRMCIDYNPDAAFVCGTMFLTRSSVLRPFSDTAFSDEDFADNAGSHQTGTLAHSLETIFGMLVLERGLYLCGIDEIENYVEDLQQVEEQIDNYSLWMHNNESNLQIPHDFKHSPLISVIIPTYNTDLNILKECVYSVLSQTYSNIELCIVDDCSPNEKVRESIKELASKDTRIKYAFHTENKHISEASNTALSLATGDWITFVDHDDLLPRYSFAYFIECINNNPHAKIIYSDEDKISMNGKRFYPHYKPDWNPDLLYSQNYVCHLTFYKAEVVKQVEGCRKGYEGSQDHDFLLRCLLYVTDLEILHIPKILYHWRAIPGSTATSVDNKGYASDASINALKDYFVALDKKVEISKVDGGFCYRVKWILPNNPPLVSLIILTKDNKGALERAVSSILEKTTYANYEIIIVDSGSKEKEIKIYFDFLKKNYSNVRIIEYSKECNNSVINNFAVGQAKGEVIGLINNDIEVINSDWLCEMVSHALRPEIGCVGAKLYYPNNTIQHAGLILGAEDGVAGNAFKFLPRNSRGYFSRLVTIHNLSAVTGACMLVRKEIYQSLGGLNETELTMVYNDVDFCLRVRDAGYRNLFTPYAELYHYVSLSRGYEDSSEKKESLAKERAYMQKIYADKLLLDPYYSPNLSLENKTYTIKTDL